MRTPPMTLTTVVISNWVVRFNLLRISSNSDLVDFTLVDHFLQNLSIPRAKSLTFLSQILYLWNSPVFSLRSNFSSSSGLLSFPLILSSRLRIYFRALSQMRFVLIAMSCPSLFLSKSASFPSLKYFEGTTLANWLRILSAPRT